MKIVEEARRFALIDDEKGDLEIGEMTWVEGDGDYFIINHTYVDPSYRGQQLASKLVAAGIEKARREGRKIFPTCPFAVKEFANKPEYGDVLKR